MHVYLDLELQLNHPIWMLGIALAIAIEPLYLQAIVHSLQSWLKNNFFKLCVFWHLFIVYII